MSVQYTGPDTTITTTGNIDNLDFGNAPVLRINNATDATIRGLLAGTDSQEVVIESIGAGNVFLAHQNAGSTAANRLINPVTGGVTPLAAGTGAAIYRYDATTARWRLVAHQQGGLISVAYAAGNFTASAGTWTVDAGDQSTFAYHLDGTNLTVALSLQTTSVSSTPFTLAVAIPNGYTAAFDTKTPGFAQDNGATQVVNQMRAVGAAIVLYVNAAAATNWSVAVNTTSVLGTISFGVT